MAQESYREYEITKDDELTITSFLQNNTSLVEGLSRENFLSYDGGTGESNKQRIIKYYDRNGEYQTSKSHPEIIKIGTILVIPVTNSKDELIKINGKNLYLKQEDGQKTHYSKRLLELQQDIRYVKSDIVTRGNSKGAKTNVQVIEQNCQVWIYSKAVGSIINVSPFIYVLNTSKNEVGSFSFSLNPILSKDDSLIKDIKNKINLFDINDIDFFTKYLQYNDIVFIRFEKLDIESDRDDLYKFDISKDKLPDQIFDMIGLIDGVSTSVNAVSTDYQVDVSGRDLMKLLVEDGNYFLPFRFVSGSGYQFFYADPNSKQGMRNFYNGAYDFIFTYSYRNIKSTFAFIINFLSNLGITGDEDLFSAYGDKRTKAYVDEIQTNDKKYLKSQKVNGIWQIIKLSVDENLEDRRIADPSVGNVDATLLEQMNKVCQKPFVEFWGDTYGSQFEFMVRQPPWDKNGIIDCINTEGLVIDIEDINVQNYNLEWEQEYYSWFQLHPNNIFAGDNKWAFATYLPIVFLDEFAEYFGNHRKIIQDIYISEKALSGADGGENLDHFKRSVLNDLKFLIESHSYLPFTRRGTINLIAGDRRIKRGNWIRFKKTGELCYVEGVSNSVRFGNSSVDRSTTLQVSRCMVEEFVKGESYDDESFIRSVSSQGINVDMTVVKTLFSYFKIVNAQLIYDTLLQKIENPIIANQSIVKNKEQLHANFGVNKEQFDFFLKRKQFTK